MLPPQGLRHAATLLLTNGVRAIPAAAPPDAVMTALEQLARELVGLADDMRAPPETAVWLIDEFGRTIARLPQRFDRDRAHAQAAAILARVAARTPPVAHRDLFLVYVPEDRLPIAAPLAVELTKRGVSVALAEYEIATADELHTAVDRGLDAHRAGALLLTPALDGRAWDLPLETGRFRVCKPAHSTADVLASWIAQLPRVR